MPNDLSTKIQIITTALKTPSAEAIEALRQDSPTQISSNDLQLQLANPNSPLAKLYNSILLAAIQHQQFLRSEFLNFNVHTRQERAAEIAEYEREMQARTYLIRERFKSENDQDFELENISHDVAQSPILPHQQLAEIGLGLAWGAKHRAYSHYLQYAATPEDAVGIQNAINDRFALADEAMDYMKKFDSSNLTSAQRDRLDEETRNYINRFTPEHEEITQKQHEHLQLNNQNIQQYLRSQTVAEEILTRQLKNLSASFASGVASANLADQIDTSRPAIQNDLSRVVVTTPITEKNSSKDLKLLNDKLNDLLEVIPSNKINQEDHNTIVSLQNTLTHAVDLSPEEQQTKVYNAAMAASTKLGHNIHHQKVVQLLNDWLTTKKPPVLQPQTPATTPTLTPKTSSVPWAKNTNKIIPTSTLTSKQLEQVVKNAKGQCVATKNGYRVTVNGKTYIFDLKANTVMLPNTSKGTFKDLLKFYSNGINLDVSKLVPKDQPLSADTKKMLYNAYQAVKSVNNNSDVTGIPDDLRAQFDQDHQKSQTSSRK